MPISKTKEKEESKLKTELRDYHKKTFEAFRKENAEIPNAIEMQKARVDDFLRKAKEDITPILKIIKTMKRIPIIERDEKTGKAIQKDFLEVRLELYGKDWKGNVLRATEYYEGFHYEPIINTSVGSRDFETGDLIMKKEHQGNKKVYDIELTDKNRKQVIQDLINNSTGTYLDEIKFYYEVPNSVKGISFRCDIYTLDQFLNSSLDELENLARATSSPLSLQHSIKDKKSYIS